MEKLPVGVAISVAFHAVVIAWVIGFANAPRPPEPIAAPVAIEIIDLPPTEPAEPAEPIEVAIVADEPAAAEPAPAPVPQRERTRVAIAMAATTATAVEPGAAIDGAPVVRNKLFAMRGVPAADLRLHRDAIELPPAGAPPPTDAPESGRLRPSGGGTYKSNEGVFTARVAQDGSVKMKDAKNFRLKLPNPLKLPSAVGHMIADWAEQPDKIPNDPEREPINNHRPADTDTRPDHGQASVPIAGGGFDITDALMRRKHAGDPYASRKLAYLDSTRDERVQIGTKHRAAQLKKSTQLAAKSLDELWSRTTDAAVRKQALFELWDDCAETGDANVVEGGRTARLYVIGFIRAKLPAGSAGAYSAQELATLNGRRQSKQAFAPYE